MFCKKGLYKLDSYKTNLYNILFIKFFDLDYISVIKEILPLKNDERAKELFSIYYGNKFFMWKDGDLEEYKTYDISQDQELIWKDELARELFSNLEVKHDSTLTGLHIIINYFGDSPLLKKVAEYISQNYLEADSFLKIRYAEDLEDMIQKCENFNVHCSEELMTLLRKLAMEILENVLSHPIEINRESEMILDFNKDLPNDQYLINRGKSLYERF